jgi:hypothetical protein
VDRLFSAADFRDGMKEPFLMNDNPVPSPAALTLGFFGPFFVADFRPSKDENFPVS